MENVIVTGGTGTTRSSLPTLRAARPRALGATEGGVGGPGPVLRTASAPLPTFDPTMDEISVRTT